MRNRRPPQSDLVDQPADPFSFTAEQPPIIRREENHPVSFDVPVTNNTNEVARFAHFACDCGCTSGHLGPQELQPGQSAVVRLTVDSSGREGLQRFGCHWRDEVGRRWTAEARVTIYKPAQFEPPALKFGSVLQGERQSRRVYYDEFAASSDELPSARDFTVSASRRDCLHISIGEREVTSLAPGVVRRRTPIDVRFQAFDPGNAETIIRPETWPSPVQAQVALRLDWSLRRLVELSPARLAFVIPSRETSQSRLIAVHPVEGSGAVVGSVSATDARIRAAIRPVASGVEVDVGVTLSAEDQFLSGEVVLRLTAPAGQELRIPVTAVRLP